MACEGCAVKFSVLKRKKQCKDCLRNYCTNCLSRRLNCQNCQILSIRPLIRSQLLQMRAKDLQHYLMAKKISTRGCVEKEDLVEVLLRYANSSDGSTSNHSRSPNHDHIPFLNIFRDFTANIFRSPASDMPRGATQTTRQAPTDDRHAGTSQFRREEQRPSNPDISRTPDRPSSASSAPNSRSRSPPTNNNREFQRNTEPSAPPDESVPVISSPDSEEAPSGINTNDIEIEELSDSDYSASAGPEPLITEHEENSEASSVKHSNMVTELPSHTGIVQLSDISDPSGFESLSVKQLKDLLAINRVDFKGCVERGELLDRASRLWEQHAKSRSDLDKLGTEDLCKICMDAPVECVILECGHMATCTLCGKQLSECPICRQYVVRVVRTFKA